MIKKKAIVNKSICVACGACRKECPLGAMDIYKGCYAKPDYDRCVGCGKCGNACPIGAIVIEGEETMKDE